MAGTIKVLTIKDIVIIDHRMIHKFGGVYFEGDQNLANPGSLEHVLEEIQGSLFGYEPYPTLIEKAAALCWRIITNHVFHDGNKRTGMEACRVFLELNGYEMKIDAEVVDVALRIAKGAIKFADLAQWIKGRTSPIGKNPEAEANGIQTNCA